MDLPGYTFGKKDAEQEKGRAWVVSMLRTLSRDPSLSALESARLETLAEWVQERTTHDGSPNARQIAFQLSVERGGGCILAGPGRGDCANTHPLPGPGEAIETDPYGRPLHWCWPCWNQYQFRQEKVAHQADAAEITRLMNALETAWGIIANVSSGDWEKQPGWWREAAANWRDQRWHPALDRNGHPSGEQRTILEQQGCS